jgi:hypothetical protein
MLTNLDTIIKSIITNPVYLEKVYLDDPDNTINYIYDKDNYYPQTLEFGVLKDDLQNPNLVKKYIKKISNSNKLILLKEVFHITHHNDEDYISWADISELFSDDKWDEIIKAYMYYNAYRLVEDRDEDTYLQVISILRKIDFNKRFLPQAKKIAIDKIKRNAIYNTGLGLKLAVKAFNKDF